MDSAEGAAESDRNRLMKKYGIWIAAVAVLAVALITGVILWITMIRTEKNETFEAFYRPLEEGDIAVSYQGIRYADSQILVTADEGVPYARMEKLARQYGAEIVGYLSVTNDYQLLCDSPQSYEELEQIADQLGQEEGVAAVSLAYLAPMGYQAIPYREDPWKDDGNPLDTSGSNWDTDKPKGLNWWAEAIRMPEVWDRELNLETVKVGLIDSMFDVANQDLDGGRFAQTWNNPQDANGNCTVKDLYKEAGWLDTEEKDRVAHGTHVAGVIAAEGGNGHGITGIAQNAELYGYSILSEAAQDSQAGTYGGVFEWKYALANLFNAGTKVINISMGYTDLPKAQRGDADSLMYVKAFNQSMEAFLSKYIAQGQEFLIVKSAGNDNGCDAAYDMFSGIDDEAVAGRILVVGAAKYSAWDGLYVVADYSNTGSRVDIYAPGDDVLSAYPDQKTGKMSGTSMAAPMVTGTCALIWGIQPQLTAEQVKQIVVTSRYTTMFYAEEFAQEHPVRDFFAQAPDNATAILDACFCVDWALEAAADADSETKHLGTVMGLIYALNENQQFEDLTIKRVTVCDASGQVVDGGPALEEQVMEKGRLVYAPDEVTFLRSYSLVLAPGHYTITVEADGYQSQTLDVDITAGEVTMLDFELKKQVQQEPELFALMPNTFYFSSGAGGWVTYLYLEDDGSFTGRYTDSDMGDTGSEYPEGTTYICLFSGQFSAPVKVDEFRYSMELESITLEKNPGEIYYEDGVRYICSEPYGLEDAQSLTVYCPGAPLAGLPEDFVFWLQAFMDPGQAETLPYYGIYNPSGKTAFIGRSDEGEQTPSPLTQEQLEQVAASLGVPDDLDGEITQSQATYWAAGECWLVQVTVTCQGATVASASVNPQTLELVRDILMYSGG